MDYIYDPAKVPDPFSTVSDPCKFCRCIIVQKNSEMKIANISFPAIVFCLFLITSAGYSQVTVTGKTMTIPTYQVADPDPNPVFFNGRRYQGAAGKVYPYPLLHNLTDDVADIEYNAVVIENEYIEVCILPELGGRIYYAKDKRNDYYFLYYNQVVKPALIGMTGAWVSGGVEWNIPHHHRASSFMPIEYAVTENGDGSTTVWVGETELRHRSRWTVGVTLYPGSTVVGTTVRVFNTTPYQNSVMAWANAAVHANTDYQVFFPPLTQYTTFHRKNQFSQWPVSYQYYDGADYTLGVDVSRWENHIKSTSFFEWGNRGNFVAGIDHGQQSGTVIFGDKYLNPGKKLWSWGNNPHGAMWDGLLTDEDGPYIELMFGSFSDNQPDYSWIQAQETRESSYWFAPLKGVEGIKKVNRHAMADIRAENDSLFAAVSAFSRLSGVEILVYAGDSLVHHETAELDPSETWHLAMEAIVPSAPVNGDPGSGEEMQSGDVMRLVLRHPSGPVILSYEHREPGSEPMPEPVSAPMNLDETDDPDSLFYAGLRYEQFHDPWFMPLDFYRKALEKDTFHVPSLTRAGILLLKAGDYEAAAGYLSAAVDRVTADYTVPENAAPLYYLGIALAETGREKQAYDLYAMAAWDHNFRSAAGHQLALLESRKGNFPDALEHLNRARAASSGSPAILALMVTMHRHTGNTEEALRLNNILLDLDPVSPKARYEQFLLTGNSADRQQFEELMRDYHENYLELAVTYGNGGLLDEAADVLERYTRLPGSPKEYPMVYYYLGYYSHLSGNRERAEEYFLRASGTDHTLSFPFRFESARALETALEYEPDDALAWYLIGNIYYDHQPSRAIEAWEKSVSLSDDIPVAYRNLAFAYANVSNDPEAAMKNIGRAVSLNPSDPRYYYEYDLYRRTLLADPAERLEPFAANHEVVKSDQLSIFPYAQLLTITGNYNDAIELMSGNQFHRWEGGESIYHYWLYAHLFKASEAIESGNTVEARLLLDAALSYPPNLQSVRSPNETIAWYFRGMLAERLNNMAEAETLFTRAVQCDSGAPECDYFAALAYEKLKKKIASESIFRSMIEIGETELLAGADMDFFDPFGRTRSGHEIRATAYFRIALGYKGLGNEKEARDYFIRAREHNPALMSLVFKNI